MPVGIFCTDADELDCLRVCKLAYQLHMLVFNLMHSVCAQHRNRIICCFSAGTADNSFVLLQSNMLAFHASL